MPCDVYDRIVRNCGEIVEYVYFYAEIYNYMHCYYDNISHPSAVWMMSYVALQIRYLVVFCEACLHTFWSVGSDM